MMGILSLRNYKGSDRGNLDFILVGYTHTLSQNLASAPSGRNPATVTSLLLHPEHQPFVLPHPFELHEHVRPIQSLSVESDLDLLCVPVFCLVRSTIPDGNRTGSIFTLRDLTFERSVLKRVIFDSDGKVLLAYCFRDAFGNGPAFGTPSRSNRKS